MSDQCTHHECDQPIRYRTARLCRKHYDAARRARQRVSLADREQPTALGRFQSLPVSASASLLSEIPAGTDISEAHEGARWLSLPLFPQGVEIAGVMNAVGADGHPLYDTVAIELPRRSTKTTAALATLLGRCLARPGYRVASTAQDGLRARAKLKEVMTELRRAGFEQQGLGKLYFSNGSERIEFSNTSVWKAVQPDPGAFRSDAFDAVMVDEAGELAPDKAEALLAGLLPTQDTRPDSQTIVAGTPGEARAGLLWDTLRDLEGGVAGVGGVVYAASDTETFLDLSDPDAPVQNLDLLRRVHPGISCGLTTVEKVLSRLPKMGLAKWSAEYLCLWPRDAGTSALDVEAWKDCAAGEGLPVRPDRVGIAWDVDPDGQQSAMVAAWRDDEGRAHFEVLACRPGSDWLPGVGRDAQAKHKGQLAYDPIGQNLEVAERMGRAPFKARMVSLTMKALVGAAARFEKEIGRRNVVHYEQPDLTEAVTGAAWRPAGKDGRLFARQASAASVATVVAASEALWVYDINTRAKSRIRIRSTAAA